jgi:hypothetical protein
MMPVGLVLSGVIVGVAETVMPRGVALALPFWAAAGGAGVLTGGSWRVLGRGFAGGG